MRNLREIAGAKKLKILKFKELLMINYLKIRFSTFSLLVSLREQGKVCVKARMPAGKRLKDKGQERQEAKTQDCQDDRRLEAFLTGNGTVSRTVVAKG
ncbi:hypothetical protein EKN91_14550 [Enterobacter hormaechei]|nr:hypothetical protein EKN91_14550 [Enterobacter hormaechei]